MVAFGAELLEVIPRTPNVSSFRFANTFNIFYRAGQYSILTIMKNRKKLRHVFSISSSPTEKGYLEYTTMLRDTDFKNSLRELRIGEKVYLDLPFGDFVIEENATKICMLAGGIGITPFRSMIKFCTDNRLPIKITLLYGSRSEEDIAFRDDFEMMEKENPNLKVVHILTRDSEGWRGYVGYIDEALVKKEVPDYKDNLFYCCGPPVMIETIEDRLSRIGVKTERIRKENFSGY